MQLDIFSLSKAGGRKVNEDTCGYFMVANACCCVLSDGLGGHIGGAIASKLVVQYTLDFFRKAPECSAQAVKALLRAGNHAVIKEQIRDERLKTMRATAVVLTIDTKLNQAFWGYIGDSRLYCFRQGKIVFQTRDHSVSQMMVDAGYLKPGNLRFSPGRNQLLAALGDKSDFEIDTNSQPFAVHDRDVFLLCSDGLWEYVEENEMENLLRSARSAEQWGAALEAQVLERGGDGQDNYSAIIVWCSNSNETTVYC